MNVAVIDATGTVTNVLVLPDGWATAMDGSSVSGPSDQIVVADDGSVTTTPITGCVPADAGTTLVASNTAAIGWTWTPTGGFVAPSVP